MGRVEGLAAAATAARPLEVCHSPPPSPETWSGSATQAVVHC